jgi:hypothetical protein
MPKPPNLIELWNNAIIQYGYIAFFSLSFPAAPMWGLIVSVFHIKFSYFTFSSQTQRPICLERDSIGIWKQILFVYSLIALFINAAILLLTSTSLYGLLGWDQNSVSDSYYIALVIIAAENVVFVIKYLMSSSISDTPDWIQNELTTRKVRHTIDEEKRQINHHRIKKEFKEQKRESINSGKNSQSNSMVGPGKTLEKSNLKNFEYGDRDIEKSDFESQANLFLNIKSSPLKQAHTIGSKYV